MSQFSDFIKNNVGGFVCELDEASSVTFGGKAFPREGWCVVLAGGPGSGKGFLQNHAILIDAKVHDVDELKKWYIKAQRAGKFSKEGVVTKRDDQGNPIKYKHVDTYDYDLKNPADTTKLHYVSNDLNLGDKTQDNFFAANNGKLPNIIFDITGRESTMLIQKADMAKKLGYKTALIWVISNRDVALTQNVKRDRVVDQGIFHRIHNNLIRNLPTDLQKIPFAEAFDEAWLLFASMDKAREDMTARDNERLHDTRAIKLDKTSGAYKIDKKLMNRIIKVAGKTETNPEAPEDYDTYQKRIDDIAAKGPQIQKRKPGLKDFLRDHK